MLCLSLARRVSRPPLFTARSSSPCLVFLPPPPTLSSWQGRGRETSTTRQQLPRPEEPSAPPTSAEHPARRGCRPQCRCPSARWSRAGTKAVSSPTRRQEAEAATAAAAGRSWPSPRRVYAPCEQAGGDVGVARSGEEQMVVTAEQAGERVVRRQGCRRVRTAQSAATAVSAPGGAALM